MPKLHVLFRTTLLILPLSFAATFAHAHPGRVDKNGGHVDKTTGIYHCHTAACISPASNTRNTAPAKVDVQAPAAVGKFKRREWGGWHDVDKDCQDTRAEILLRDSAAPVTFKNNKSCAVARGQWHDPYTGDQYYLALSLDIDHIVPLEWANNHGGAQWSKAQKRAFTNEERNLIAVGAGVNRDKGAQGPDKWLPPDENYHCIYLAKFLTVYQKYALQFLPAERQAITAISNSCDLAI